MQEFGRRQPLELQVMQRESTHLVQLSHMRRNELIAQSNKVQRETDKNKKRE